MRNFSSEHSFKCTYLSYSETMVRQNGLKWVYISSDEPEVAEMSLIKPK